MSPILASIRSLLPDAELRAHMAARAAHHIPATGTIDPPAILTLEVIEQGLARGVVPMSELRVFGEYTQLDLERAGVAKHGFLRPQALRSLARQGATIVVNHAQRLSPELWDLACEAERWLGTGVTLAAVASFGRSGIELHYDTGDLIIVQLEGSKQWSFFGPAITESARRFSNKYPDLPTEITEEVEMRRGDLLYVPSGLFHRCTPGAYSLHLGIIATHASGGDFAKYVNEQMSEEAKSSAPLNGFLGPETVLAEAEAIKARLIERIQSIDPLAWFAERQARRARMPVLDLSPGAPPADGVAALNTTMGPDIRDGKLSAGSASVAWSPATEAVTAALREGPRPVAEIRELLAGAHSGEDVDVAMARLSDAGLVRIDPS